MHSFRCSLSTSRLLAFCNRSELQQSLQIEWLLEDACVTFKGDTFSSIKVHWKDQQACGLTFALCCFSCHMIPTDSESRFLSVCKLSRCLFSSPSQVPLPAQLFTCCLEETQQPNQSSLQAPQPQVRFIQAHFSRPLLYSFPGQRARPMKTWMNIAAVSIWIKKGLLLKFIVCDGRRAKTFRNIVCICFRQILDFTVFLRQ